MEGVKEAYDIGYYIFAAVGVTGLSLFAASLAPVIYFARKEARKQENLRKQREIVGIEDKILIPAPFNEAPDKTEPALKEPERPNSEAWDGRTKLDRMIGY